MRNPRDPYYREVVEKAAPGRFRFPEPIKCWEEGNTALALEAIDIPTGQPVVIKILWTENIGLRAHRESLIRSAEYLKKLNDLSDSDPVYGMAVRLVGNFTNPGKAILPFIVLEYFRLPALAKAHDLLYKRPGFMPLWDVLPLCRKWAEFLGSLHRIGRTYPDCKPLHIFWDGAHLKVIDFNNCDHPLKDGLPVPQEKVVEDVKSFALGVLYPLLTSEPPILGTPKNGLRDRQFLRFEMDKYSRKDAIRFREPIDRLLCPEIKELFYSAALGEITSAPALVEAIEQAQLETRAHANASKEEAAADMWAELRPLAMTVGVMPSQGRQRLEQVRWKWEESDPRRLEVSRLCYLSEKADLKQQS